MRLRGTNMRSTRDKSVDKRFEMESINMDSDRLQTLLAMHKKKRYRSAFTTEQITYLEKQFRKCHYVGIVERKEVAKVLNLSERAVKIWFQNRRMKEKKEHGDEISSLDILGNVRVNGQLVNDNSKTVPLFNSKYSSSSNKSVNEHDRKTNADIVSNQCLKNPLKVFKATEKLVSNCNSEHKNISRTRPKPETNALNLTKKNTEIISPKATVDLNQVVCNPSVKVEHKQPNKQQIPNEITTNKTFYGLKTEDKLNSYNEVQTDKLLPEPTHLSAPLHSGLFPYNINPYYELQQPVFNVLPEGSGPTNLFGYLQPSFPRICCKCDCHLQYPTVPMYVPNGSNSQYLLTAIPFPKPNTDMP